ncbi:MAG: hypothetical protein JWR80_1510 [Bradyrhizobium sp.]|nr:hypothetical protein [Bradyrhizobium sp.]
MPVRSIILAFPIWTSRLALVQGDDGACRRRSVPPAAAEYLSEHQSPLRRCRPARFRSPPLRVLLLALAGEARRRTNGATCSRFDRLNHQPRRRHAPHQRSQFRILTGAEGGIETGLGDSPMLPGPFEPLPSTGCQMQLLAAAIDRTLKDSDKAVSLQRENVPPEGGSVHDYDLCQAIDAQRSSSLEFGEDRKLRGSQTACCQMLIIILADMPRGLADREAGAELWRGRLHLNLDCLERPGIVAALKAYMRSCQIERLMPVNLGLNEAEARMIDSVGARDDEAVGSGGDKGGVSRFP